MSKSRLYSLVEIRFHERTVFISVRCLSESEPYKSHRENDEKQDWRNDYSHRHRRNHKRLRPLLLDHATSLQDIHHCLFVCFAFPSDLRIAESRDGWKAKTIIRILLTKPEYITNLERRISNPGNFEENLERFHLLWWTLQFPILYLKCKLGCNYFSDICDCRSPHNTVRKGEAFDLKKGALVGLTFWQGWLVQRKSLISIPQTSCGVVCWKPSFQLIWKECPTSWFRVNW